MPGGRYSTGPDGRRGRRAAAQPVILGRSDRLFLEALRKSAATQRLRPAEAKELRRRRLPDGSFRFGNRADRRYLGADLMDPRVP